jgi:hypothetical protein
MNLLNTFCAASLFLSSVAFAQQDADRSSALVAALSTPKNQWIFNHICVPIEALPGPGYSNRDFLNAYLTVAQARWTAALEAKANSDEHASMKELAKILHGIIDAYWPGRLQRDASGAIVAFRDCESLGNLPGVLSAEKSAGPDDETRKKLVLLEAAVIARWKNSSPFDEVKPILESGPMKLSAELADSPLLKRP